MLRSDEKDKDKEEAKKNWLDLYFININDDQKETEFFSQKIAQLKRNSYLIVKNHKKDKEPTYELYYIDQDGKKHLTNVDFNQKTNKELFAIVNNISHDTTDLLCLNDILNEENKKFFNIQIKIKKERPLATQDQLAYEFTNFNMEVVKELLESNQKVKEKCGFKKLSRSSTDIDIDEIAFNEVMPDDFQAIYLQTADNKLYYFNKSKNIKIMVPGKDYEEIKYLHDHKDVNNFKNKIGQLEYDHLIKLNDDELNTITLLTGHQHENKITFGPLNRTKETQIMEILLDALLKDPLNPKVIFKATKTPKTLVAIFNNKEFDLTKILPRVNWSQIKRFGAPELNKKDKDISKTNQQYWKFLLNKAVKKPNRPDPGEKLPENTWIYPDPRKRRHLEKMPLENNELKEGKLYIQFVEKPPKKSVLNLFSKKKGKEKQKNVDINYQLECKIKKDDTIKTFNIKKKQLEKLIKKTSDVEKREQDLAILNAVFTNHSNDNVDPLKQLSKYILNYTEEKGYITVGNDEDYLKNMIKNINHNDQKRKDLEGLSDVEKLSLNIYSSNASYDMNDLLRCNEPFFDKLSTYKTLPNGINGIISELLMHTAIAAPACYKNASFLHENSKEKNLVPEYYTRRIEISEKIKHLLENVLEKHRTGDVDRVPEQAFSSATVGKSKYTNISSGSLTTEFLALLYENGIPGIFIQSLSCFPGELEFLLAPGVGGLVYLNIIKTDASYVAYVRFVETPKDLPESTLTKEEEQNIDNEISNYQKKLKKSEKKAKTSEQKTNFEKKSAKSEKKAKTSEQKEKSEKLEKPEEKPEKPDKAKTFEKKFEKLEEKSEKSEEKPEKPDNAKTSEKKFEKAEEKPEKPEKTAVNILSQNYAVKSKEVAPMISVNKTDLMRQVENNFDNEKGYPLKGKQQNRYETYYKMIKAQYDEIKVMMEAKHDENKVTNDNIKSLNKIEINNLKIISSLSQYMNNNPTGKYATKAQEFLNKLASMNSDINAFMNNNKIQNKPVKRNDVIYKSKQDVFTTENYEEALQKKDEMLNHVVNEHVSIHSQQEELKVAKEKSEKGKFKIANEKYVVAKEKSGDLNYVTITSSKKSDIYFNPDAKDYFKKQRQHFSKPDFVSSLTNRKINKINIPNQHCMKWAEETVEAARKNFGDKLYCKHFTKDQAEAVQIYVHFYNKYHQSEPIACRTKYDFDEKTLTKQADLYEALAITKNGDELLMKKDDYLTKQVTTPAA